MTDKANKIAWLVAEAIIDLHDRVKAGELTAAELTIGICSNVLAYARTNAKMSYREHDITMRLRHQYAAWTNHSGDEIYPVPVAIVQADYVAYFDKHGGTNPAWRFFDAKHKQENMYDPATPYGRARLHLLEWLYNISKPKE